MKNYIITLSLCLFVGVATSQDLAYEIKGSYVRGIAKEKLAGAKTMSDIRTGYPSSWISNYLFTQITMTADGQSLKALGVNENLSIEQQQLLQKAEIGNEIKVVIEYSYINPVTKFPDVHKMEFIESVVPEVEAEFPGGDHQLREYVQQNAINKIPENLSKEMHPALVLFTISDKGKITNIRLSASSNNAEIDAILLHTISKMPAWKPAENGKGVFIPQEFEFRIGNPGC